MTLNDKIQAEAAVLAVSLKISLQDAHICLLKGAQIALEDRNEEAVASHGVRFSDMMHARNIEDGGLKTIEVI